LTVVSRRACALGRPEAPALRRRIGAVAWPCLLLLLPAFAAGCGYALAGRGSFLPSYIKVVGIPPIENRTAYQRIEQPITEHVRNEFIGRGKYTVVQGPEGADAILRGEIVGFQLQPAGLTEQQGASRYLITLVLKVTFTDVRTNDVLWSNDALRISQEYELGTSATLEGSTFVDQQRSAIDRIAADVARTVVTSITEAF
jgi:hypothetical protein